MTTYTADDGTVLTGDEALAAFDAHIDEQQELRQRFAREHPEGWARHCRDQGYIDAPPLPRIRASVPQGHAPREGQNTHQRGSRRSGDRARSSSSDDPDPEPEPRTCESCGAPLDDHLRADAKHCNDAHRARHHRAATKAADEATAEDRRLEHQRVAETAVAKRHELWYLTNLADRANGAVTKRAALNRAIAEVGEQLAEVERQAGPDELPRPAGLCECDLPMRDYDEGGDPYCIKCVRHNVAPTGTDRGVSHLRSPLGFLSQLTPKQTPVALSTRLRRRTPPTRRFTNTVPPRSGVHTNKASAGDSRRPQKGENR